MATQIQEFKETRLLDTTRLLGDLKTLWNRLMTTKLDSDTETGFLSRLLNGLLFAIFVSGTIGEIEWLIRQGRFNSSDVYAGLAILLMAAAYLINKRGHLRVAAIMTVSVMIFAVFATGLPTYMVFPILLAEFFFTSHTYTVVISLILTGILVVFQSASLDNFIFLTIFAASLSVIKRNYRLLEEKRKWKLLESHQELMEAYDATIAGWSTAMDLHDRETEGHSQRVAELTLSLGEMMGVSQEEQINIHRGALLHDIGKLGIPDSILHKPGPLTEDEWVLMRQHPTFALHMLSTISYLQPALDIPYCHHEKWDGSGYPRGLKGEQIPLSARIFAAVDVWDALTSDRPYRAAWNRNQALIYISEQSGRHFSIPKSSAPSLCLCAEVLRIPASYGYRR